MQIQHVRALAEPQWITVPEDPDGKLRLKVVPGESAALGSMFEGEVQDRLICRRFFVDFEGYLDGQEPVPNSLDARLELLKWQPVRRALQNQGIQLNERIAQGEAGAASA